MDLANISSIVISLGSAAIAFAALYFAHLKGPVLKLATSSSPLEIISHGERNGDFQYRMSKGERCVIVSTGLKPGILYSIELKKKKHVKYIESFEMNPLPVALDAGHEFPFNFKIFIDKDKVVKKSVHPEIEVIYTVSRSLGRSPKQKAEILKLQLIN